MGKLIYFDNEDEIVLREGDVDNLINLAHKYEICVGMGSVKVVNDNGEVVYITGGVDNAPIIEGEKRF